MGAAANINNIVISCSIIMCSYVYNVQDGFLGKLPWSVAFAGLQNKAVLLRPFGKKNSVYSQPVLNTQI